MSRSIVETTSGSSGGQKHLPSCKRVYVSIYFKEINFPFTETLLQEVCVEVELGDLSGGANGDRNFEGQCVS